MGKETGQILGEICADEVTACRPMLSSVAVGVNGKPGPGFFALARELDLLQAGADEISFWHSQRAEVYKAWKRPLLKATKTEWGSPDHR